MTLDHEDLINSIMESLGRVSFIHPDDIPNIDLYMDQVTAFIDKRLKNTARHPSEERILTKTMINNYAKNNLLPPPDKKRYNKEHILILIYIYYFKNILSISDIRQMLNPLTERYFGKDGDTTIASIYEEVASVEKDQLEEIKSDIMKKYQSSHEKFEEIEDEEEQEFLRLFAFICSLSYDVYVKKLLIEKILDVSAPSAEEEGKKGRRNKKR